MKRDGGDFEEHASANSGDRQEDKNIAAGQHLVAFGDAHGDHVEVCGPGDTVKDREAVRQNARAERSHQQVFHRRFVRTALAAEKPGEYIEAERHRFEPKEQDDEIVATSEKHHAGRGEKHQRIVFAVLFAFELHVTHGKQNHKRGRRQKQKAKKNEKRIDNDGVVEGRIALRSGAYYQPERDAAEGDAKHSGNRVPAFLRGRKKKIRQQNRQREEDQHRLRKNEGEVHARLLKDALPVHLLHLTLRRRGG